MKKCPDCGKKELKKYPDEEYWICSNCYYEETN